MQQTKRNKSLLEVQIFLYSLAASSSCLPYRLSIVRINRSSRITASTGTMPQSGPNSGGDLFDIAKDGTKVPENAAEPRYISSKPRPDQVASAADPNYLGGRTLADAATNAEDIPRVRDLLSLEIGQGIDSPHRQPAILLQAMSSPGQGILCLLNLTLRDCIMSREA